MIFNSIKWYDLLVKVFIAGKINIDEAEMDQSNLLENMVEFNENSKPRKKTGKGKKIFTFENVNALWKVRKLTLSAFKSGIFPTKSTQGRALKILNPKQTLQRLPIALTQVKAGNTILLDRVY